MKKLNPPFKWMTRWVAAVAGCMIGLLTTTQTKVVEAYEGLGGPPHIGTFEGSTTFTTSSSNGINPGLYLEVMDAEGNYTEYTSEEGIITIPGTQEGAYVTQAKLLGKTKYRDQETGEILDNWEDGRNLELESVQMPVLTTAGKNLFDINIFKNQEDGYVFPYKTWKLQLKPSTNYIINSTFTKPNNDTSHYDSYSGIIVDGKKVEYLYHWGLNKGITNKVFTTGVSGVIYLGWYKGDCPYNIWDMVDIQLEEGSVATSYEPYKSNILTVNEDIELRGIGDVQDTLDLTTGELVQNFGSLYFDGSENWNIYNRVGTMAIAKLNLPNLEHNFYALTSLSDKVPVVGQAWTGTKGISLLKQDVYIAIEQSLANTNDEFKRWLSSVGGVNLTYQLAESTVKTVALNSTYYFDPVLNRDVRVNGTIVPLVASVTIPTDPLSFIIDPNQDEGMEFIAPEFSITNQTPGSIYLNLKAFEQTTNVLNDVLPTTYPDWHQLDKHQSKDIALALVPKPSDGWMSLTEGPRYVADSSNYELGMVKAKSTVDFTFSALHGRTFVEELNPQYRLSFEFGF